MVGCNVQVVLKKDGIVGSFSFDVTKRILQALEHNEEKKTNLAQKTGLNYNACMRYIGMLKTLGWIQMCRSDEGDYVSITVVGRQVSSKLLNSSLVNAIASNTNDRRTKNIQAKEKASKQPNSLLLRKERIGSSQTSPINQSMSIMIIDDEPDILLTYQSFLTPEGYNVELFSDPYDALHKFIRHSHYDLVILDVRIPGLNGIQLFQCLKAINPSCKIIFVSALDLATEILSMLPGTTSDDIIKKPFDRGHLLIKVNEIFRQRYLP